MVDGWDGRVPECEGALNYKHLARWFFITLTLYSQFKPTVSPPDVVCGEPPKVPNAVIEGLHELPYTYRTAVRYRCLDGTIIGKREIWCTKDGTWSAPPPQCTGPQCY